MCYMTHVPQKLVENEIHVPLRNTKAYLNIRYRDDNDNQLDQKLYGLVSIVSRLNRLNARCFLSR